MCCSCFSCCCCRRSHGPAFEPGVRYFWDQESDEFATHAPYTNIKLCPLSVSAFQALAMSRTHKFLGGPSKSCDWGDGICILKAVRSLGLWLSTVTTNVLFICWLIGFSSGSQPLCVKFAGGFAAGSLGRAAGWRMWGSQRKSPAGAARDKPAVRRRCCSGSGFLWPYRGWGLPKSCHDM